MTQYTGSKSLDAEIEIDFKTQTILFDYSKNKLSKTGESSHSAVLPDNEWGNLTIKERLPYALSDTLLIGFKFFISCGLVGCQLLSKYIIKNDKLHLYYQDMLRWISINRSGTFIQESVGSISGTTVSFTLENNVWFKYELTGDYETNIKKISLLRNFVKFKRYGEFYEMRQNGWNVIFEFAKPPQSGKCVIEHT